jgi:hypothetical protein
VSKLGEVEVMLGKMPGVRREDAKNYEHVPTREEVRGVIEYRRIRLVSR